MALRLYHCEGTRSERIRWLLRELEAPHALLSVDVAHGEHRRPEYLALSPLGAVPTLVDGAATLDDPAAIVLHLTDRYAHRAMCPPVGSPARARYYQFVLEASALDALRDRHAEGLARETVIARVVPHLRVLGGWLSHRAHLLGAGFSAADLCIADALAGLERGGLLPRDEAPPVLREYLGRVLARPARANERPSER